MTDAPRQRRTAAAVIERIQKRIEGEQQALLKAEAMVAVATTRIAALQSALDDILADVEPE